VTLVRSGTVGFAISGEATEVTGSNVSIEDTQAQAIDGEFGYGLEVSGGATLDLGAVRLADNRGLGVVVAGAGSIATLEEIVIEDTRERDCVADACAPLGNGLDALYDGSMSVSRFRISGNPFCGVQIALGGTLDLSDGVVAGNAVGANVQTEGFDLTRIQKNVRWTDNVVDLDSSDLALPEPAGL
jgi:hypothetical protein